MQQSNLRKQANLSPEGSKQPCTSLALFLNVKLFSADLSYFCVALFVHIMLSMCFQKKANEQNVHFLIFMNYISSIFIYSLAVTWATKRFETHIQ